MHDGVQSAADRRAQYYLGDPLRRKASEFLAAQATRLDHDGALDNLRPQARAAGLDI